jgi:hypothetical protein
VERASFDTPSATGAWCATVLDVGGHSAGNVTWNTYFNRFVLDRPWSELPEQPNHGNNEYQGVCLCGT